MISTLTCTLGSGVILLASSKLSSKLSKFDIKYSIIGGIGLCILSTLVNYWTEIEMLNKIKEYNNLIHHQENLILDNQTIIDFGISQHIISISDNLPKHKIILSDIKCVVCDNSIDMIYSCGHFSYCQKCTVLANANYQCPICRQNRTPHKMYF